MVRPNPKTQLFSYGYGNVRVYMLSHTRGVSDKGGTTCQKREKSTAARNLLFRRRQSSTQSRRENTQWQPSRNLAAFLSREAVFFVRINFEPGNATPRNAPAHQSGFLVLTEAPPYQSMKTTYLLGEAVRRPILRLISGRLSDQNRIAIY